MEDTTSEATSPYISSQTAYTALYDQFIHADAWNSRQHTNGVVVYSQANQYQLNQAEPSEASDQPRARCRRAKLNEAQKKEHKRQSDMKYRLNQKTKVNELSAENKRLQEENRQLKTENRRLQEENGRLTVENTRLEEHIRGPQSRGKHPAEYTQRQDSYISQSISQLDHQNVCAQDHRGLNSSNEEAIYMGHCRMDSDTEGAADRRGLESSNEEAVYMGNRRMDSDVEGAALDGLEINDLRSLLLPEIEMNQNGRAAIHEFGPEHPESSLSGMCHADMAVTEFLFKLDEEVLSNADCSDFTGLEGEQITFRRYDFPLSLISTVERITDAYGDVSAASLINSSAAGTIYVLFCATIKEMDDLQLEQVTEQKLFKWRDTIKDALRINFNVRFAMEHLKKIARAYFGLIGSLLLQGIDARISQLEAEVNNLKMKRAETYEGSKLCIAAAEEFTGVPVSTGLFP